MEDNKAKESDNKLSKKELQRQKMKEKLMKGNDSIYFMPISDYVKSHPPFDEYKNIQNKWLEEPYKFGTWYYRLDGSNVFISPQSQENNTVNKVQSNIVKDNLKLNGKSQKFNSFPNHSQNQSDANNDIKDNEIGFLFNEKQEYIQIDNYEVLITEKYEYFIYRPASSSDFQ